MSHGSQGNRASSLLPFSGHAALRPPLPARARLVPRAILFLSSAGPWSRLRLGTGVTFLLILASFLPCAWPGTLHSSWTVLPAPCWAEQETLPQQTSPQGTLPPEFLPADHWAHAELNKLWVAGMIDSLFPSTRSVSRYDVASLLASLQGSGDVTPGWAPLERLRREFAKEMRALGAEATHESTPFVVQRKTTGTDFRFSVYAYGDGLLEREDRASMQEGSRLGFQAWAIFDSRLVLFEDIYAGKVREGWRYGEELFSLEDVLVFTDRFYIAARTRYFEAQAGRDRLRWGPGRTGTLLLSDSAPAYTLLYVGKTFGRSLKLSTVTAILDSEAGKYMAGHRVEIAPARWLNLGVSETAVYHASQVEPLYAVSLVPFTLVERLLHRDTGTSGPEDPVRNNVLVAADASLRPARGLAIYGELMLDDLSEETSERPTRLAYQAGTSLSRPMGQRNLNLLVELTRVWNYTYSVDYSQYFDRDHSHQGLPLGYYLGPDSRRVSVVLSCDFSTSLEAGVAWDEVLRGQGTLENPWSKDLGQVEAGEMAGIVEKERTASLFARWLPRDNFTLEGSGGFQDFSNRDHLEGEEESFGFFSLRLSARW